MNDVEKINQITEKLKNKINAKLRNNLFTETN